MGKILTKLTVLVTLMFLTMPLLPTFVHADAADDICAGADCERGSGDDQVGNVISSVIDILSVVVGIAAVITIIVGGLKYITSSGDSSSVNSAKNTILYAMVGLAVVVLSQIIARFVLDRAGGSGGSPPGGGVDGLDWALRFMV